MQEIDAGKSSVFSLRAAIKSQIVAFGLRAVLILFGITVAASTVLLVHIFITDNDSVDLNLFQIVMMPLLVLISFLMGWLIDRKQPGHTIALLFLIMAYSLIIGQIAQVVLWLNQTYPGGLHLQIASIASTIGEISWIPGVFIPLLFMPLFFPTGHLLTRRWRIPLIVFLVFMVWYFVMIILRPWPWPENDITLTRPFPNGIAGSEAFFDTVQGILTLISLPAYLMIPLSIFLRYRRAGSVERTQMKWPMTAIALLFTGIVLSVLLPSEWTHFDAENGYPITWTLAMLFPLSIGIGILRHNLFDIDIIINRALVYGILTALIIVLYVVIVSALGGLVQAQTSVLSGLVATGIVAVLFQPLRDRLQKIVNHVLYGQRDDPAAVLSRLAYHLETADTPAAILPNLVQTIAHTLKIPYVAIWLSAESDQSDHMEVVAEWGNSPEQREMISLTYQNRTVGHLVVAPRSRNEHFTAGEQMLLATIAALTAITVRAVQLSDELRHSRQRIVTAREEERRRIRRDLHDGLGPQLASQTLGLGAVAQLMPTNQQKALALLESLQAQAHEAILDVRRLVYDLRPPALDDLGLVEALRQSMSRYETGRLRFSFDVTNMQADLPAAVETAAFRIAQEAITNVVRHAGATHCRVRLVCTDNDMVIEIQDDGCGLPEAYRTGIGLHTIRERATELGGLTTIESLATGGTRVRTKLPLEVSDE